MFSDGQLHAWAMESVVSEALTLREDRASGSVL